MAPQPNFLSILCTLQSLELSLQNSKSHLNILTKSYSSPPDYSRDFQSTVRDLFLYLLEVLFE